jgi:hypothetical protein
MQTTKTYLYRVYFRGTSNVAANIIPARSARAASAIASAMVGTPLAYLVARKVLQ